MQCYKSLTDITQNNAVCSVIMIISRLDIQSISIAWGGGGEAFQACVPSLDALGGGCSGHN